MAGKLVKHWGSFINHDMGVGVRQMLGYYHRGSLFRVLIFGVYLSFFLANFSVPSAQSLHYDNTSYIFALHRVHDKMSKIITYPSPNLNHESCFLGLYYVKQKGKGVNFFGYLLRGLFFVRVLHAIGDRFFQGIVAANSPIPQVIINEWSLRWRQWSNKL